MGWTVGEGVGVEGGDGNGGGGALVLQRHPTRSTPPQSPGPESVGRCVLRCV